MDECWGIFFFLFWITYPRDKKVLKYNFSVFNLAATYDLMSSSGLYTLMVMPFLSAAAAQFLCVRVWMHMCLALADAGPWISNSISLHNWNINHMEKENEVENKPLKLFSWPAGFLLFTNFLHSTRNMFPFFFALFSLVSGSFTRSTKTWCCHMIQNSFWLLLFLWLFCCCYYYSENRKFIVLFCTSLDTITFFSFFLSFIQPI